MGPRRVRGFTLVELMVVVAIVGIVAVMGTRLSSKYRRGSEAGGFARQLAIMAHEARETAIALKTTTRIRIDHTNARVITEQVLNPLANPQTWTGLGGSLAVPSGTELCNAVNSTKLASFTPVCPATSDDRICFASNGHVDFASSASPDVCPTSANGTGATMYAHTKDSIDNTTDKKYRVSIYGLTGLAKFSALESW